MKRIDLHNSIYIFKRLAALVLMICLALSAFGCRKSTLEKEHVLIFTTDGAIYLDDSRTMLAEKSDDDTPRISTSLDSAVVKADGLWYYVKDGVKTQIGKEHSSVVSAGKDLSWILYQNENLISYLLRPGKEEEIRLGQSIVSSKESPDGRYLGVSLRDGDNSSIVRVDLQKGEILSLYEGKTEYRLRYLDDDGTAYYQYSDFTYSGRKWYASDGEPVLLEGVKTLGMMGDRLLLGTDEGLSGQYTWYTRPLGPEGELTPLAGRFDVSITEHIEDAGSTWYFSFGGSRWGTGYHALEKADTNVMIVDTGEDLWYVDLRTGKTQPFFKGVRSGQVQSLRLSEDRSTVYALIDEGFWKLTYADDGWKQTRIAEGCARFALYGSSLIFRVDRSLYAYDGKKSELLAELPEGAAYFDVSLDLRELTYTEGRKIMYVKSPGAEPECVVEEAGSQGCFCGGWIYYCSAENELMRLRPGGKPVSVMKNVKGFYENSLALLLAIWEWN